MKQLKPINVDAYVMSDVQAEVDDRTQQSLQSLHDDAAMMTRTCIRSVSTQRSSTGKGKTPTVRRQFPYPTPELDQENRYEVWRNLLRQSTLRNFRNLSNSWQL